MSDGVMLLKQRVLLIDAEDSTEQLLTLYFKSEGFELLRCRSFMEVASLAGDHKPDIIISELSLSDIDGFDMIRIVRERCNCPLIILTERNELFDKVVSLELGCDDYIVKPFEPKELIARMRAIIRRYRYNSDTANSPKRNKSNLVYDNLVIDQLKYTVKIDGNLINLPPKEFELLYFFVENSNQVFSRKQILEKVWKIDHYGQSRTVDVHVKRLREKLDAYDHSQWEIKTIWGVGYKFQTLDGQDT